MAPQAAQFDLSTSSLDQPKTLAYGLVRGAGNLVLQQELTDKSRVSFYILGEGPWDSILRLWINNKLVALPAAGAVHFHPGFDGEIGNGLAAVSTGGDQHVDQFFTLIPGGLSAVTFSRFAWLALKTAPDKDAPSATLTVLADYQALQVRQFDAAGSQTAFAWTQNWAWNICDFLIRKFVLRESKANQPLVAAELARFDWASFVAAAGYFDGVLSLGQKRFSDGGVVFVNDSDTADRALEQMLLITRSYILERNGKFALYADQPRASVFAFSSDNIKPKSFVGRKSTLRTAANRLTATYRDLNIASGSADSATRFAISTLKLDHEAHQRSVGARGPGLSVMPKITELALDLAVNTPERVWRILDAMLVRQLGDDVDGNTPYVAPFSCDWTGFEDSLAVEPGDVVFIDKSISEEFGSKVVELLQCEYLPNGEINYTGLEYMPNAFSDVAGTQQALLAPIPGTGIDAIIQLDANGNPTVPIDTRVADGSVYSRAGAFGKNLCPNPGFELNTVGAPGGVDIPVGSPVCDGWTVITKFAPAAPLFAVTNQPAGTSFSRTGNVHLGISVLPNVSIPAASIFYEATVQSARIPVRQGDILRIAGFGRWDFNIGIPAGLVMMLRIAIVLYDSSDAVITSAVNDNVNNSLGAGYRLQQVAFQLNSANAAYVRVLCAAYVQNPTGAPISTPNGLCADLRFDDLMFVLQATAFDLTPANSSGRTTNPASPLSQVGATTQISVATRTYQFPDGTTTPNTGSRDPLSFGTWFVFFDDPLYAGGTVTYQASLNESDLYAANGRISCGKITTAGGGGAVGVGGGGSGGGRVPL